MCLILFSYKQHPHYRLVLAANRDEYYDRPAAPLQFWKEYPDLLAGRDLKSHGTWMGVTKTGRIAAITNYREPGMQQIGAPSRGHLISNFLISDQSPAAYLERIRAESEKYNGFNLLVGDNRDLIYFSNRGGNKTMRLGPNTFGLSNRSLDTPWPKVMQGKKSLTDALDRYPREIPGQSLLDLLKSQDTAPDEKLPVTGVGIEWERVLSPIFITSPNYGTRCSTILTIDRSNHLKISEHTWQQGQPTPHLQEAHRFDFVIRP